MTAPRSNASHDQNHVTTLMGVSTVDGVTPVPVEVDPVTGQVQMNIPTDVSGNVKTADATAEAIAQAVYDALTRLQPLQHDIPYARDINDQLRVVIGSGSTTVNGISWANAGSYAAYYSTGGANSIDAREQMELQSLTNFNLARNNRWTFA